MSQQRGITKSVGLYLLVFGLGVSCPLLFSWSRVAFAKDRELKGLDMKLFSSKGPFQIYIGQSKEKEVKDFAIFKNSRPLISHSYSEETKQLEITHFENGFSVLFTEYDPASTVLVRHCYFNNERGDSTLSYVDKNGDGRWDVMLDFELKKKWVRQGDCWVGGK